MSNVLLAHHLCHLAAGCSIISSEDRCGLRCLPKFRLAQLAVPGPGRLLRHDPAFGGTSRAFLAALSSPLLALGVSGDFGATSGTFVAAMSLIVTLLLDVGLGSGAASRSFLGCERLVVALLLDVVLFRYTPLGRSFLGRFSGLGGILLLCCLLAIAGGCRSGEVASGKTKSD